MYFIIRAFDKPNSLDLRLSVRSEHLSYATSSGIVVLAGPALDSGSDPKPCGSLLIVKAGTLEKAQEFAKNDPYEKAGLFEKVIITPWVPAIGDWKPDEI